MKKDLVIILFPYLVLLNTLTCMGTTFVDTLPSATIMFCIFLIVYGIATLFVIKRLFSVGLNIFKKDDNQNLVKSITRIKFLHIPAYLFLFYLGVGLFFLPLGFIYTIIIYIADCTCILYTGIYMMLVMISKYKNHEISLKAAVLHSILGFIFCIDIIDAIYLRFKKTSVTNTNQ